MNWLGRSSLEKSRLRKPRAGDGSEGMERKREGGEGDRSVYNGDGDYVMDGERGGEDAKSRTGVGRLLNEGGWTTARRGQVSTGGKNQIHRQREEFRRKRTQSNQTRKRKRKKKKKAPKMDGRVHDPRLDRGAGECPHGSVEGSLAVKRARPVRRPPWPAWRRSNRCVCWRAKPQGLVGVMSGGPDLQPPCSDRARIAAVDPRLPLDPCDGRYLSC